MSGSAATWLNWLVKQSGFLSAWAILAVSLIIVYEAVARRLGHPTVWVFHTAGYFQVFIVWMGLAWVQQQRGNVDIDMLTRRLKRRAFLLMRIIAYCVCMVVVGLMVWAAIPWFVTSIRQDLHEMGWVLFPVAAIQWPLVLGIILTFFVFLGQTLADIMELSGKTAAAESTALPPTKAAQEDEQGVPEWK